MNKVIKDFKGSVLDESFRKQYIVSCVDMYKKQYPTEYQDAVKHAHEVRKSRANVFGLAKEKTLKDIDFRFTLTIPFKLFQMISQVLKQPEFLYEHSEYQWFVKTFKEFTAAQKV